MKDKLKGCMMHQSDLWETPKEIYDFYCAKLGYFDPCPKNPEFNGLEIDWKRQNFVNPPYSQIAKWVDKTIEESNAGCETILLVPARTDTKWFHKLMDRGCTFKFIKGRLKFGNSKNGAPFPSVIIKIMPWFIESTIPSMETFKLPDY